MIKNTLSMPCARQGFLSKVKLKGGTPMTQETYQRKLTAILSADVEGYSRLMGEDEDTTIKTLTTYRELMTTLINKHRGRVVDSPGDNLLAEFTSVVDAVRCAVEIQEELRIRNAELSENKRMHFRIGINLGDVVEEGERIYGDGINIAARVEGLAEGGGICISGTVYDSIKNKLSLTYESLGEHTVKNITEPVRVYRMRVGPEAAVQPRPRQWHKAALAALVVLIVVAGAFAIWNFYFRPPSIEPASIEKMAFPLPDKPSIAVLPFVNMSEDHKQEYFSDGLTDQIINSLTKMPHLFVIARISTFAYKGKTVKVQKVAEDLGVRYVLEGSVQRSAERVRITAQLIDAITGLHIWSERYDRELKDIFVIQDDITMEITKAMRIEITEGEQARLWQKRSTVNLKAYLKFLEGTGYSYRLTKEDNTRARQLFEEAIALDPGFANAYVSLGYAHWSNARFGWVESRAKSIKIAFKYAQKAIELDDTSDLAHTLIGGVYLLKRQHEKNIAQAERAIAINPNGAWNNIFMAGALGCSGRWEESLGYAEKAMRLAPFPHVAYYWLLGRSYFMTGQYDKAIKTFKKAVHINPDYLVARAFLAASYSSLERQADAAAQANEVLRINPKFSLESYAKTLPYKNKADTERYISALHKAGLPKTPPLPLPDKPSIAVLPFTNMSGDPKQEYFSDGMTEEIIMGLSKVPNLFVIARNSTFVYKGKSVNIQQVSKELGVRYVLEGSVRKAEERVRITAQLIDATTGNHVWSERYDRNLKDIFALQDEITLKIMTALQVKLTEGQTARLTARGTKNLEAYLKCLEAREHIFRFNKESNALAREKLKEAIALDPNYPAAYRFLGGTHFMDIWLKTTDSPKRSLGEAIKFLKKAISLDPSYGDAHALLGFVLIYVRQYEKAVAEAEKGVALCPSSAASYGYLGGVLRYVGRSEEAIQAYKKALRLNPFSPTSWIYGLGIAYLFTGQCEQAIEQCLKAVHLEPKSVLNHVTLTAVLGACGREEDARSQAKELLKIQPNFTVEYFGKRLTNKNDADKELILDGLRKAGLK
jgi:adenylate cyclase